MKPTHGEMIYLLEISLTGNPENWWQIVKPEVTDFNTFEAKFVVHWNEQTQHEVRRKLEFGFYRGEKGISRAEYAISLYTVVGHLTAQIPIQEDIKKLSRHLHFSEKIKYAILGRGITQFPELINLFETFDSVGASNQRSENKGKLNQEAAGIASNNSSSTNNHSKNLGQGNMQPRPANSNNNNWTNRNTPNGGTKNAYNSTMPSNNWRNASTKNNGRPGNSQQNGYKVRTMDMQEYEADGEENMENKEEAVQTNEGN